MIEEEPPLFLAELETIAKRIVNDITSENLRPPCCITDPVSRIWRREIAGETLYVGLGPSDLKLALAERSAVEVKAAWDAYTSARGRYTTLRNRSEWCRGIDPEDIDDAREDEQDARKRFAYARSGVERRWQSIGPALAPLLDGTVREEKQCPTSLCRTYLLR